jgi:hypothetical protein
VQAELERRAGQARAWVAQGRLDRAVALLETCRSQGCVDEVQETWLDARDRYVHFAREQLGRRYLEARAETDLEARQAILMEIRGGLAALADRFPDSRQVANLRRNIELVQHEIESLQR